MNVAPNDFDSKKQTINSSDAITGHKLQGLTKYQFIIYLLMKQVYKLDIYYISRVETIKGLSLLKGLHPKDIKPLSKDYPAFMKQMIK